LLNVKWIKEGGKVPTEGPVYVGIDLSLTKTAVVALSEHGRFYWWRLHQPKVADMAAGAVERLAAHRWMLHDFLDSIPEPEMVCLEGYAYGRAAQNHQVGELGGLARLLLYDRGLEYKTVPLAPSTLKKFVTGKGNAQKNTVLREVYRVWGIEAEDDNVADAYGLAQAAMTISTGEARYAWQRDALRRTGPPSVAPDEP
jgi:crossover junction endodeoxyribonuclease RuvC